MGPSPRFTADPRLAAAALAAGDLAVLPTETVYGLGGLASSDAAVSRIFSVKGRPANHPVIVHLAGAEAIGYWSSDAPATAFLLAERFWPGPLTLVVPRSPAVPDSVTGGQPTVALRAPAHPGFAEVLAELCRLGIRHPGIAAPSANRFGKVSPTTAADVRAELGPFLTGRDVILDGGPCLVGVESTIVICHGESVEIARSGGVTADQLAEVVTLADSPAATVRVPGALAAHYAPDAQVIVIEPGPVPAGISGTPGLIGIAADLAAFPPDWPRLAEVADPDDYARQLYAALRRADTAGLTQVIAVNPPAAGIGIAVRDRLSRAATGSAR